jgi:hypothetical protein
MFDRGVRAGILVMSGRPAEQDHEDHEDQEELS